MSAKIATTHSSRFPVRGKPKLPSIVIPPTPAPANEAVLGHLLTNAWTPVSPILIPPRIAPLSTSWGDSYANPPPEKLTASNIASPDLIAIAELFNAMKRTLGVLGTTFESLGKQTERMVSIAPVIKAAEQIKDTRTELQAQVKRQEASMQALSVLLENAIKDSVIDQLKEQILAEIQDTIGNEVKGRVQRELAARIPIHLCQPVGVHTRQRLEARTSLSNCEADYHITNAQPLEPLRPLLRPLPTPQQSPTYVVRRSLPPATSLDPSPLSAFPRLKVPAPTPTVTSSHYLLIPGGGNQYIQVAPPMPSPLFPRDLKSLFAFSSGRRLLKDYGIDSIDEYSPATDDPRPKAAPIHSNSKIPSEPLFDQDDGDHTQNIHKFMFHVGVRSPSFPESQVTERPKLHVVIPGARLASVAEVLARDHDQ